MSDHAPRLLVVAFSPFPAPSGAGTRLAQRITAFCEAGYAVEVLTPKAVELPYVSRFLAARILRVPMPAGREPAPTGRLAPPVADATPAPLAARHAVFERAVARQLRANEYDLVHTTDPYTAETVLQHKGSARVVFEAGGGTPTGDGDTTLATELRRRERELFRGADIVLAPSDEVAVRARGLGATKEQVHVLRPSADLTLFAPSPERRRRPPVPMRVAVTAASLSPPEVSLLVDALRLLPRTVELEVELSAALTPGDALRLRTDEELSTLVTIVPPALFEELPDLYRRADVGLVLAPRRLAGNIAPLRLQVVAEMLGSGLACVLPDLPATRELVEPGRHAMVVAPGDAEALASALENLAGQPTRRRLLSQAARQRAEELLAERTITTQLLALYGRLLSPSVSVDVAAFGAPTPARAPAPDSGLSSSGVTRPTDTIALEALLGQLPPRAKPAIGEPLPPGDADGPTDPDQAIQGRRRLADLSSAAPTGGEVPPRRSR